MKVTVYVIFSWPTYAKNPVSALYLWEGGLAIYGGILGGLLAGLGISLIRHRQLAVLAAGLAGLWLFVAPFVGPKADER